MWASRGRVQSHRDKVEYLDHVAMIGDGPDELAKQPVMHCISERGRLFIGAVIVIK
jgi:hypothetical protein